MVDLIVFLTLLALGFGVGRYNEARHYRSILRREALYKTPLVIPEKTPPPTVPTPKTHLVSGSVVISVDHFKQVLAALRGIFRGRITSYESLLDRARREAILRMRERAHGMGANMIFNVKLETTSISKGSKGNTGSIEVYAYGTALIPPRDAMQPS